MYRAPSNTTQRMVVSRRHTLPYEGSKIKGTRDGVGAAIKVSRGLGKAVLIGNGADQSKLALLLARVVCNGWTESHTLFLVIISQFHPASLEPTPPILQPSL